MDFETILVIFRSRVDHDPIRPVHCDEADARCFEDDGIGPSIGVLPGSHPAEASPGRAHRLGPSRDAGRNRGEVHHKEKVPWRLHCSRCAAIPRRTRSRVFRPQADSLEGGRVAYVGVLALTSVNTLVPLETSTLTPITGITPLTIAPPSGETVRAIDVRPSDGRLYALTTKAITGATGLLEGRLYSVQLNPASAVLTGGWNSASFSRSRIPLLRASEWTSTRMRTSSAWSPIPAKMWWSIRSAGE